MGRTVTATVAAEHERAWALRAQRLLQDHAHVAARNDVNPVRDDPRLEPADLAWPGHLAR